MEKEKLLRIIEFVANLLPWGVPLVIGWLAWLQNIPWYIIALSIIIAFGVILWIKNQFDVFRERRKKGLANRSDQEIRETIRDWLDVPYLSVEPKDYPDKFFQFDVTGMHGIPVTVERLRTDPYLFNLGVKVTWEEKNKVKLKNLREPMRSNLINKLKIEMLRLGIQFVMSGQPFDEILLLEQIPLDNSLTRFYFLQRIFFVVRAASLVKELTELGAREILSSELTLDKEDSQTE